MELPTKASYHHTLTKHRGACTSLQQCVQAVRAALQTVGEEYYDEPFNDDQRDAETTLAEHQYKRRKTTRSNLTQTAATTGAPRLYEVGGRLVGRLVKQRIKQKLTSLAKKHKDA